ncbi:MAG: fatty acid desaturase [Prochloraceae cyanobacterium]|nr:fatty acid desaturase [Prochloraceae cyanobacterium]
MTGLSIKPENLNRKAIAKDLQLRDIIRTLPSEVFIKDPRKAWLKVVINLGLVILGYYSLAVAPWFLLPLLWVFTGTALTGCFVIAHDCGHRSFSNSNRINDLVGHIALIPLMYPFHAWRILHDRHHKHTNKLGIDNAWDVFTTEFYESLPTLVQWGYRRMRGRFWWLGSIAHWAKLHFDWNQFEGKQREQVKLSVIVVYVAMAVVFPTLFITSGIWGFVKFWLIPFLVYHFWMSTFTIVHHTTPDIPFKPAEEWHEAEAQLAGTVHCDYPGWVEYMCHDINVHIPHHISTGIPWYNLRKAHQSLKENWGEYLYETKFSWSLMNKIADNCHLHDADTNYYMTFAEHQERK